MKKISKVLALILIVCLLIAPASALSGTVSKTLDYPNIRITLDGKEITPTDITGKTVDPFLIDGTTYLPVRAISEALGCTVEWDGGKNTVTIRSSTGEAASHTLKAGAGIGEIMFAADYLSSGTEGFSGEYLDVPHARVLLLEDEATVAIVSLELVQASAVMDQMQEIVSEALDLPVSQIWIHCTHATTTPHPNGDTAPYMEAVSKALKDACSQAKASLQPAVMGVGTVELDINANRNIPKPESVPLEQWTARNSSYGLGGTEYSDKELTIVRFDSLNGDPIGFYMSYPMKPSGLDQAGKDGNERLVTADVQGVACTMVEEELGGVCMFVMPAAADQISKESATFNGIKEDGSWGQINLSVEEGINIIERYGAQMGDAAIKLAKGITADVSDADIQISYTTFDGTAVGRDNTESPTQVRVDAITLGDSVSFIGFLPELDAWTGHELKEASPYQTTLLVSFLNGDSKYMPHDDAYNYNNGIGTQETQSGSAAYARGTAEKLVQASVDVLTQMQDNTPKSGSETVSLLYDDIQIVVDGKTIIPTDANGKVVEPFIIDGTTYLPVRAISEALGCTITWNGATNTVSIISPQAQAAASHTLKAGAGIGEIKFDTSVLIDSNEGFSGEFLDIPHARVLLLEDEATVAIVSMELVQASSVIDQMLDIVSTELGIPTSNIWIHCTHTTTTPHAMGDTTLFMQAVSAALKDACSQAKASLQPAVMGVGTADLDINANRNIPIPEGVSVEQFTARNSSYGLGGTEYSDKELTIVRFDSLNGDPIACYMSYPMKPSGLDQAGKAENARLVTADVQGVACTMVEEELGGVCMFVMPAAADQISKESATFNGIKEDGSWGQINLTVEEGIDIIERYGKQMGDAAVKLAKGISTDVSDADIQISYTTFDGTAVGRDNTESPTKVRVDAITLGDSVSFIGFLPELDAWTGHELKEASPYQTTLLVSFLNGDSKYMPHDDAYNYNNGIGTQETQSGSAAYARGTAEKLVQASVELLNTMMPAGQESGIQSIQAGGFMAPDGVKLQTIIVEYGEELSSSSVSLSDFEIQTYGTLQNPACDLGGNPGKPVNIYVNKTPEVSAAGGTSVGKYVIIEINTNYQLSSMPTYKTALVAGVKQVGFVNTADGSPILPGGEISNYTVSEQPGMGGQIRLSYNVDTDTIRIPELEKFDVYTGKDSLHVTNCYSEITGNLLEADLMYSLYVPDDYTDKGNYGLALVIPDSTGMSDDDPWVAPTTTQNAVNLISPEVQAMAKANGMDGLIVLVPEFTSTLDRANPDNTPLTKATYDDFTLGAGVPAAWQLLDHITAEYKGINTNRIFGLGGSAGAMMLEAMASQRDNYFAGLWIQGGEWGSNYKNENPAPVDGKIITNQDYENWYYAISDDNILLTTCADDTFAYPCAKELYYLYEDIAGVSIPTTYIDPLGNSLAEQMSAVDALLAQKNDLGIYWIQMTSGVHLQTFIYGPRLTNGYAWLLAQTKESEDARSKLTQLTNDWALETDTAKIEAKQTEDRIWGYDADGNPVYCAVPAQGAGTNGYNSTQYERGTVKAAPGT